MSLKFPILLVLILLFVGSNLFSQDILNKKNLSEIKIDQLSDDDILKYEEQLKSLGISTQEAEQLALARGMSAVEIAKLRTRIENLSYKSTNNNPIIKTDNSLDSHSGNNNNNATRKTDAENDPQFQTLNNRNSKIFGYDMFSSSSLSFEPNLHIATPLNYVLGANDAVLINVYGQQEVTFNQTVSPEGNITIPTVGVIKIGGMTIEQATSYLKSRMEQIGYRTLRSGKSKLSLTLTKIRSISVTIVGAVKSGNFTVSSLSSVFNVLYLSGGPATNRSFRTIQLIRDNKVYRIIDLYKFLLYGDETDNVNLKDNDLIRLPVYSSRVEIEGEIKRPGIFEMLPDETLSDLIKFSGGFSDSAYKASIKVIQLTDKEKRVKDINSSFYENYKPSSGDYFEVSKILNRFENRVVISGAVFRPGAFEITNNLTVGQLIRNAEGLKEDAFRERGQIIRLNEENEMQIIPFDINQALKGGEKDILLKREDSVVISSLFDLKDRYNITIQGEVRKPGVFNYEKGITLKDLILQAGGLSFSGYPERVEIARLIKRDTLTAADPRLTEIIIINGLSDLSLNDKNIALKPYDVVTIRKSPGFTNLESIDVHGEVQFPGYYVLSKRTEKVSDLIKRAGGFSPEAFPEGAYLKRSNIVKADSITDKQVVRLQKQLKDSTDDIVNSYKRPFDVIPLDLNNIIANPNSEYNLILKGGDELVVPRNDQEIKISGDVYFPTQSPYLANKSLKKYVNEAGGFTETARKKKVYILYTNGRAVATHHILFFNLFPKVRPGAEIIVPKALQRKKMNTAETIGISSALASLAGVVIAIIQLTKK